MDASPIREDGWPCQRLRIAIGAILFFAFEVFVGQQLPTLLAYLILAVGLGCLLSAMSALRSFRVQAEVDLLRDAFRQRSH